MSEDFLGPLMDDFFAESEEHIVLLRRGLLYLEENDRSTPIAEENLRGVLRSLHTVKGLAGMVGFEEAERLAHALEDWIRDNSHDGRIDAERSIDPLFEGVGLLERVMAARRSGSLPLDVGDFVGRHATRQSRKSKSSPGRPAAAATEAPGLAPVERFKLDAAVAAGQQILDVEFVPSSDLVARGVGVEVVRERLGGLGAIVHAAPRVLPGRGVAFRFLVAAEPGASLPDKWREDGLQWQEFDPASHQGSEVSAEQTGSEAAVDAQQHSQAVVRVELSRLDELMRLIGEMVLTRGRLSDMLTNALRGGAPLDPDALEQIDGTLERQLRDLRAAVMRVRLVPVGEVFERMRFVVRDLVAASDRRVRIEVAGEETEIDKMVVERMMEPLLHIVRNAVTHGIEPAEERAAHGKPEVGLIRLSAGADGDRIIVEVADDGRGVDPRIVATRARSLGFEVPDPLDDGAVLDILCLSGFSTSEATDRASGRGVGMDVVRATTRAMGGDLSLMTAIGGGTTFRIELPLTLMVLDALLVRLGDQTLAVPQLALHEVLQVAAGEVVTFERNEVVRHRGGVLPVVRLSDLFDLPRTTGDYLTLLVVGSRSNPMGLAVDGIVGLREIVVRPLTDPLVDVRGISGAAELGDGSVSLIIDVNDLLQLAHERRISPSSGRSQHV